ncbi:uncharacterized protein LOC135433616 [Drosophila montana]|uniref:uncharacterized protein LOC135433616 n=1 Tax=Drosophila montana TaxID=40370 RepID=UPI00313F210F
MISFKFLGPVAYCLLFLQCAYVIAESDRTEIDLVEAPGPGDDEIILDGTLYPGNISLCKDVANRVFLPYVGDCRKYYLCWDGKAVEKQCNKDYEFNARNQSCGYPNKAACMPECEEFKLTTFCYDRTCTKYVLCYFGIPVLRECHDGLQYNAETDRCDFPQYVDCVDNECMRLNDTTELLFLPSKASCSKYFLCAKGVPMNYTCAEGLSFSTSCNCCDYPEKSDCQITALKRNIQPYSRVPLRRADVICPSHGVHFYAHKSRRDAYYYCLKGHGVTLDCTPGLWYDASVQECREPKFIGHVVVAAVADRWQEQIVDHIGANVNFRQSTVNEQCQGQHHQQLVDLIVAPDPEDDVVNDDGTVHPLDENGINLSEGMADSLLPYVGNCSSYIICEGGNISSYGNCYEDGAFEQVCADDATGCEVLFDYKFQACVGSLENDVKCLPECEEFNLTSFCYDRTCTKYVLCYYGIPVLRECHDGLQYNAETDRCDFPEYVDCVDNDCPDQMSISNIVYLPSKAQCSKYFICSDGMAWPQECASGLVFNPECNCCDYASKVECQKTAQQRNIQPYSRSPPRRADITCPSQGIHFYAHKSRRDAYYYCVEGHGVTLDCTPGLLYDSKIHECREPKYIAV